MAQSAPFATHEKLFCEACEQTILRPAASISTSMERVAQFPQCRSSYIADRARWIRRNCSIALAPDYESSTSHLDNSIPTDFAIALEHVVSFADPLMLEGAARGDRNPIQGNWI